MQAAAYKRTPLPNGEPGIRRTGAVLLAAIKTEAALPVVREAAADIVSGCSPHDGGCRARRILSWVSERMEYLPDPLGIETVALASWHLKRIRECGKTFGDCDDGVALIGTLVQSVGLPVRVALASFRPDGRLHHTWIDVLVAEPSGQRAWIVLDPFRSERFGRRPLRLEYVR